MTYEEFVNEIKKIFRDDYGYPKAQMNEYFSRSEVDELLRRHYAGYTEDNIAGYSPAATASCLDMLYDQPLQLAGLIINDIPDDDRNEDDENE